MYVTKPTESSASYYVVQLGLSSSPFVRHCVDNVISPRSYNDKHTTCDED